MQHMEVNSGVFLYHAGDAKKYKKVEIPALEREMRNAVSKGCVEAVEVRELVGDNPALRAQTE
eukprot:CAMPEP_0173467144 /NCGR_PEP_ID=MMETSP1357-20121228/74568_1 /TAXON_ID=77926 /ORGANISM="Hemiselmis rufescens, Strain PCC563" /LENGTH=62 /DNA_ID=CAMNT_0014435259 /DNA_START=18 /DNA_END=203 /DNA_ORIENTATION=+